MTGYVAESLIQDIAQGFFDGLAIACGAPATGVTIAEAAPPAAETIEALASEGAIIAQGAAGEHGVAAMILRKMDLAAYVQGAGMGEAGDPDSAVTRELLESALGGAVDRVREAAAGGFELGGVQISAADAESIPALMAAMGGQPAGGKVSYPIQDAPEGEAWLLLSAGVSQILSPDAQAGSGGEPQASPQPQESTMAQQSAAGNEDAAANLDMILDIQLVATARLGGIEMPLQDILSLGPGSIIEIGHGVDEPVELLVNGKLIARGDVVVVDERFGLRITEIVSQRERVESLR